MAVVIAKYIQPNAQAKGKAKDNIRYIQHRPGRNNELIWRTLFNSDGRMTRLQGYEIIDNAEKGTVFWKIKISPDPKTEDSKRDLSMQEVTERTMNSLQDQLGKEVQWIAAIHADHKPHRHIHILAKLPKLSSQEFRTLPTILIDGATESCRTQHQEFDQIREHHQKEQEREGREAEQWERQQARGKG